MGAVVVHTQTAAYIDVIDWQAQRTQLAVVANRLAEAFTVISNVGDLRPHVKVQQANADGLRFLKEASPDAAVLQIKSLEAFEKAADGQATKIIIPSEIQGMAGLATSIKEVLTK